MRAAGMKEIGDEIYQEFAYPASHRLLRCCDAILRIEGESRGTDGDVLLAKELGMLTYHTIDGIPRIETNNPSS